MQGPNEKGPHGNQTCMIDVSVGHWPRSFVGCNVPLRETHMSTVFQNGTVLSPFIKHPHKARQARVLCDFVYVRCDTGALAKTAQC